LTLGDSATNDQTVERRDPTTLQPLFRPDLGERLETPAADP
jgi:hypothetical protein